VGGGAALEAAAVAATGAEGALGGPTRATLCDQRCRDKIATAQWICRLRDTSRISVKGLTAPRTYELYDLAECKIHTLGSTWHLPTRAIIADS
jgi:hypothetical protein